MQLADAELSADAGRGATRDLDGPLSQQSGTLLCLVFLERDDAVEDGPLDARRVVDAKVAGSLELEGGPCVALGWAARVAESGLHEGVLHHEGIWVE